MKQSLKTLKNILYSPIKDQSEDLFASLLSKTKKKEPQFPHLYEIEFIRHFNNKTNYYSRYIHNATNSYLDNFKEIMDTAEILEQKYLINDCLKKMLPTLLEDTGKQIQLNKYDLEYINPHKANFQLDIEYKNKTYIIHYLKLSFIKIYLEIQEQFKDLLPDESLLEEDLYLQYLKEPVPQKSFLKETQIIEVSNTLGVSPQGNKKPEFNAIKDDNRPPKKGVLSYFDLIRNQIRFATFEEKLFANDYIDHKFEYCGKHGYLKQLAIIAHHIIEKNYFHKFNNTTKKVIVDKEITKFLEYRYNANIDKQFRELASKPTERANFTDKHSWIINLPPS